MICRKFRPLGSILGLIAIIGIFSMAVSAQSESGRSSLEGTVVDPNGGVIQGAIVEVRSVETGFVRNLTTGSNGRFVATVMPVGTYNVKAAANGFSDGTVKAVLTVGETTAVEIRLSPQGAEEIVTVTDDAGVIDTEEASSGSSVEQRAIRDLPVRGRNYTEFVQLSPGVVQEGDRSGLVIAGQRSINSNVALDGADFNDSLQGNQRGGNEAVFFFPQTAIREFQVVRAGATAEVGRTNAGFVNAVTKSGSNDVRGEVFFFNETQANALDAWQ